DEDEPRRLRQPLLSKEKGPRARRAGRIGKKPRRDEQDDDCEEVKNEREQHAFARGDRVADRRKFGPIVLEIEIHEELTPKVYQPEPGGRDSYSVKERIGAAIAAPLRTAYCRRPVYRKTTPRVSGPAEMSTSP